MAFAPASTNHTLGQVLSERGLKQLRLAETEKYAHVTFFFNGGIDATKYNLITWFTQTKYQPKALIVSFEFINAILTCDGIFENFNIANYEDERVKQISDVGDTSGLFPTRQLLANKILERIIHIPIIQIEFSNRATLFKGEKIHNLLHSGELSEHQTIANLITTLYNNKIKRLMP